MRKQVLSPLKFRGLLTTTLLVAAGFSAGCSADAVRLDDGFYTGAMPQTANSQVAAANRGYGAGVDQTMTGSISQAPGGMTNGGFTGASQPVQGQQPAYGAASTASVQRGQLPPPPQPNYQRQQSQNVFGTSQSAYPQGNQTQTPTASAQQRSTLGAPPSTLQDQASRIASPGQRPGSSTAQTGSSVKVASGDTLSAIARRSGVSAQAIRDANNMTGDTVRLGQTLIVPTSRPNTSQSQQQVAAVESAPKPYEKAETSTSDKASRVESKSPEPKAASEPEKETKVAKAETRSSVEAASGGGSQESAPQSSGIAQYRWPVQGRVLQRFGEKVGSKRNDGLNISVPRGTPVKAAENGVVIYAGDGLKEFGNTVLVKHDDGLVTVYGHADELKVKRGETVKRGQEIASSGMSGDTDVPQLHFEVRKNSAPIDPTAYLK